MGTIIQYDKDGKAIKTLLSAAGQTYSYIDYIGDNYFLVVVTVLVGGLNTPFLTLYKNINGTFYPIKLIINGSPGSESYEGIATDGKYKYFLDGVSILPPPTYLVAVDQNDKVVSVIFVGNVARISGLTFDGKYFWTIYTGSNPDELRQYQLIGGS